MNYQITDADYVKDTQRLLDMMCGFQDDINEFLPNEDGSFEFDWEIEDANFVCGRMEVLTDAIDGSAYGDHVRGHYLNIVYRAKKHREARDFDALKLDLRDFLIELNDLKCVLLITKGKDSETVISRKITANLQLRIAFGDKSAERHLDNYFRSMIPVELQHLIAN